MDDIRLKIWTGPDGQERVAVGVAVLGDEIGVLAMHDELPALAFRMSTPDWNDLPHHTFHDLGPAEKPQNRYPL